MININIPFGGFYGSIHESLINDMLSNYFSYDNVDNFIYDDVFEIDYNLINNEYIKQYIENLNEFLNDNYDLDIIFHNLKLISPKEYNFKTDEINCNISNLNHSRLMNIFKKDDDFIKWLHEACTSYDGYMSFYNFHNAYNNKDNILINYIFKYICTELFNEREYLSLYDMNNNYELLYKLDFFTIQNNIILHDIYDLDNLRMIDNFLDIENMFYFKLSVDDVLLNSINHNFVSILDLINNYFTLDYKFKYLTVHSEAIKSC